MSRFLIACGGTGGHLAPGIAMAEWLRDQGHHPLLLISHKRIDARLTEKYPDFEFEVIPGAPLLVGVSGLLRFGLQQFRGLLFSWSLIRRERPVAIIGFGGFTTASLIFAGWLRGVPVALHEANRVVGRAVRVMARFADRIYVPREVKFTEAGVDKLRHAGLPVRNEIERVSRSGAAERFGLDPSKRTLVVLGGSQGAQALNDWAESHAADLVRLGAQLLVVTGPGKGEGRTVALTGPAGSSVVTVRIPFCDQMADLYSVGDLIVSRAGAGTLAELVRCRLPAVLVPYPFAADGHQAANAQGFARHGGGLVVSETEVERLWSVVESLLFDDDRLATMRAQLGEMERAEALELMFADLENLAGVATAGNLLTPMGALPS